jgi:protein TonB
MKGAMNILAGNGAFELKRSYRRNLSIGVVLSSFILILVACASTMLEKREELPRIDPIKPEKVKIERILPPRIIDKRFGPTKPLAQKPNIPESNMIIAVDDSLANNEAKILTQQELDLLNQIKTFEGISSIDENVVIENIPPEIEIPNKGFVYYEEAPVIINRAVPLYPEMARRAGVEAEVWINVLVDVDGSVRRAEIIKVTAENAGFEQAALDAALKSTWKPAIANNNAIPVWVTYKIEFKLR